MASSIAEHSSTSQKNPLQPSSIIDRLDHQPNLESTSSTVDGQVENQAPTPSNSTKKTHPFFNPRKRSSSDQTDTISPSPSPVKNSTEPSTSAFPSFKKPKRQSSSYAPPSRYAHVTNLLTDSISPNLICLFIGLNPGIRTATQGHAYSHPSNLFWRLVHRSGCTPRLCRPEEDGDMPRLYSLGLTNIVARTTKDGAELSKDEMDAGVAELERKIATFRPEAVAIVGKSIWESIWRVRHGRAIRKAEFRYGWQDDGERMGKGKRGKSKGEGEKGERDDWKGARLFVATTTSGLAAGMSLREKEEIWRGLGAWVEKRRAEREVQGNVKEDEEGEKQEEEEKEKEVEGEGNVSAQI